MKFTDYVYSPLIVCHAEMEDGETWTWQSEQVEKSYTCYMLSGKLMMSRSTDPDFVSYECGVTGQFTKGDVLDDTQVAVGNTSWVCLSKFPDKPEKNVELQKIESSYTLQAQTGFVVLEGSVTTNTGITANQFQYFRPRDTDIVLTGQGTIALIW